MLVIGLLAGFLFLAVGVLTATDVPDEVIIENSGYKKDRKDPVKLHHKKHATDYKVTCVKCHHENENMKPGDPVKKCSECHDPQKKQGETLRLDLAYHKNCWGCHKEMIDAGKTTDEKAPSKKCSACHAKVSK